MRMPRATLVPLVLTLVCAVAVFAQPGSPTPAPTTATPATVPATTQASVPTDQTTPRGALKMLTIAMNNADTKTIEAVLAPGTDAEHKMVDALTRQQQAILKLREAANKQFGADGARRLLGDIEGAQTEALAQLDQLPEQITGDAATVGDGEQQLQLKRVEGKWVMPVAALAGNIPPAQLEQGLAQLNGRTDIFVSTADEMTKGIYKTADDASNALRGKLMRQVMGHDATTQPGTSPTTQAAPKPQAPVMPQ